MIFTYKILPFQFKRLHNNQVLLVNESGDFTFISNYDFDKFRMYKLDNKEVYDKLFSHCFLTTEDNFDLSLRQLSARYVSRKAFLREFTTLHMMVITLRCNQQCEYCQVACAEENASQFDMSVETAKKIIDCIFESPTQYPKIEFQGGEPTLNWKVLSYSVLYAEQKAKEKKKNVDFVICTNLVNITEEQLCFCKEHNVSISTSLDGNKMIHDTCRKMKNGHGTYEKFVKKLKLAREIVGQNSVNALMTTTSYNLDKLKDIIDEYIFLGFKGIFIRALNPYGFAAEKISKLGYDTEEFVKNYFKALDYIIEINKKIYFKEYFSSLLLSRILTPFSTGFVDLQSPSGAGICGSIYDYDGSVYPADEARMLARMGDNYFKLGNVNENTYDEIFLGKKLKNIIANSCVEICNPCAWCCFQSYCGCDPVRNYLEKGNIYRNMSNSSFCIKHKQIIEGLFERLNRNDSYINKVFWSWVTSNPSLVN